VEDVTRLENWLAQKLASLVRLLKKRGRGKVEAIKREVEAVRREG
jgi:hypothetical protein